MSQSSTPLVQLELHRKQSITTLVQAEIERMILDGELAPDARINEQALAQRLGVSRGPIREACRTLLSGGLIESKPNRGFFVRTLSETEAIEAYHARAAIIAYAGMTLATNISQDQLAQLHELLERMDEAAKTGEISAYDPINLEFHDAIMRMAGNGRLRKIYQDLLREQHLFRHRGLVYGNGLKVSNLEHRAIVDALASGDPQQAFVAMRDHVLGGMQRMLNAHVPASP